MLIERFAVQGFKNLTAKVELTGLGPVNVIHGDNGVGKSNLLEAMTWLFRGLARVPRDVPETGSWSAPTDMEDLAQSGQAELFTLGGDGPILTGATLRLSGEEVSVIRGDSAEEVPERVRVGATLQREGGRIRRTFQAATDPVGDATGPSTFQDVALKHRVFAYVGRYPSTTHDTPNRRFELVNGLRQTLGDAPVSGRHLIPSELLLRLYDARESIDKELYSRWELFKDTLSGLSDILGPGELIPLYDRKEGKANLALQRPEGRLPIHLLGSGAQQLIALIARLALTEADFIGIEEPELNLRYTHQLRLRDLLLRLTSDPRGPRQIFITSHSPAFETGDHFYAMTMGPEGPVIAQAPNAEATRFTQQDLIVPRQEDKAPLSYLTSEGLLQVPADVRQHLGLPGGGGVVLVDSGPGVVEMMANETWLARTGLADDDEELPDDGG